MASSSKVRSQPPVSESRESEDFWLFGVVAGIAPAVLCVAVVLVEQLVPLGFSRWASSNPLPEWAVQALLVAARYCRVSSHAAALVALAATTRPLSAITKIVAVVLSGWGYAVVTAMYSMMSCGAQPSLPFFVPWL